VIAATKTGKRVAVVGSGPAGLTVAQQLARAGHSVTVYEKSDRVGGLLRYGIPDFKMEKHLIDRRVDQMRAEGVEFRVRQTVENLESLRSTFDAVCLALGAEQARDLRVPGRDLNGIHLAMDFLAQQNVRIAGGVVSPATEISAKSKRVVVIGGGDTGSDCVGTAHRQGAASVTQLEVMPMPPVSRAASTPWPLWPMQLRSSHAHEEGARREWAVTTTEFVGVDGRVTGLKLVPEDGSEFTLDADLVLLAMGFSGPVRAGLLDSLGAKLDFRGGVLIGRDGQTSVPGVFAAGDARRGASLIVWAIAEGRKVAAGIDAYLRTGNA
jgi:glutamate synthase (NADPH/NADH) small chain